MGNFVAGTGTVIPAASGDGKPIRAATARFQTKLEPDVPSPGATTSRFWRAPQRVGVGIFRWSPAWIGIVSPGFMSSIRL